MTSSSFLLPVSPRRDLQPLAARRTGAQRRAIQTIAERSDFAYAVNNPCTDSVSPSYCGPFNFYWIDTNEVLHVTRIGKTGKTLAER